MLKVPFFTNRKKGFSLVEVVISISIFALLTTSLMGLYFYSISSMYTASNETTAVLLANEGMVAMKDIRDTSFHNLVDGVHGITLVNNRWTLTGTPDTSGNYTRQVTISSVDLSTKLIALTISWPNKLGQTQTRSFSSYVSAWTSTIWYDSTAADFNAGTKSNTAVSSVGDGEVQLWSVVYADWCNPSLTLNMFDLPGQGIAKSISAQPGNVYMGTGSNSSGVSFARMSFVPSEPPVVSTLGIFDGYKTNAIYGEGNYAYLATQTNNKEIVILNVASTPYTEIGNFNPTGNGSGYGIFVNGNTGIMATSTKLFTFDLSSKTGSRPVVGSINLKGTVTDLFVRGNFAYVTLSNSTTELEILDLTNPASIQSVGWFDLNNAAATTVFVNEANTRAYVGTGAQASQREFFVVDVVNKVGNHTSVGSYETNGMTATDIVVPVNSNRAIVVGSGGSEQYQVIDISSEGNPLRCGGLSVTGVKAIASVTETNGNVYSHVVTSNATTELRTIQGGPGGGGGNGYGYPASGTFESRVFDTGKQSYFYNFSWTRDLPAGTTLKFQLRAGDTSDLASKVVFRGPDGTILTYYTVESGEPFPTIYQNKRFVQYKAYFTSDTLNTPVLQNVRLQYE